MIWKDRLFLFWMTAVTKPQEGDRKKKPEDMAGEAWGDNAKIDVELTLSWGEYYQGKWTSPKSSELAHPLRLTGLTTFNPSWMWVAARTEQPSPEVSERLVMSIAYLGRYSSNFWFKLVFTSKNIPPLVEDASDPDLYESPMDFNAQLLWNPQMEAHLEPNSLRERISKEFKVRIQQPERATATTLDESLLTKGDWLNPGYRLLPLMHPVQNQWEAPFVYSDEHSLFSVHPDERIQYVPDYDGFYWNDSWATMVPPELLEIPPLEEEPVVIDPVGPIINPVDVLVNPVLDQVMVKPALERVIRSEGHFVYQGVAFGAHGIVNQEVVR
jgi:hypothetical protein